MLLLRGYFCATSWEIFALFLQIGLFCVALALITSYGLCSYLDLFFSPLHNFIPFLLLGLGVDDMFVVARAYDVCTADTVSNLHSSNSAIVSDRISRAMRVSGVAITVTTLTDFLAFATGGTTVTCVEY